MRTLELGALGIGCCLVVSLSASLAAAANGFGAKGSPAPAIAEESQAEALLKVTLPPGWNMVSFTALAAAFPPPPALAVGPAYTLQAGDSDYESLPQPGTPGQELLRIGGFWIYLGRAAQMSFTPGGRDRLAEILPPSQFVMIGNPSSEPATVFGADVLYTYDPDEGTYHETSTLGPGQGAFAYSAAGGVVIVTSQICPADPQIVCLYP